MQAGILSSTLFKTYFHINVPFLFSTEHVTTMFTFHSKEQSEFIQKTDILHFLHTTYLMYLPSWNTLTHTAQSRTSNI